MQRLPQRMVLRENFRYSPAQKLASRSAEEFFRRGTHHHGARIAREQKQAILQTRHYRIQVFAHGAEDFMHAAQLLAYLRNLAANQAEFIGTTAKAAKSGEHCEAFSFRGRRVV